MGFELGLNSLRTPPFELFVRRTVLQLCLTIALTSTYRIFEVGALKADPSQFFKDKGISLTTPPIFTKVDLRFSYQLDTSSASPTS